MSIHHTHVAASTLLVLLASSAAMAAVHPRPLPQRNISRGLVTRPRAPGALPFAGSGTRRHFFGTITQVNATTIVMMRRNGRTQIVDTSGVLQSGLYSAPLFVGKAIGVVGTIAAANGPMFAIDIERLTRIDNVAHVIDQ